MSIIKAPKILMPNSKIDMQKWAVVACDQFTSQLDYWQKLTDYVGDAPSTLKIIFPEAYLSRENQPIIDAINANMKKYLEEGVIEEIGECMVLVDRSTSLTPHRLGLVLSVDLEAYSFVRKDHALIRATEGTVIERIPPRKKIRVNASIEIPHILLLIDDREQKIIEELYANKDKLEKLYDFDLNMGGGHVTGYKVTDTDTVIKKFDKLLDKNYIKRLYGDDKEIMQFAVGDGNHSLATAKACWDSIKGDLTEEQRQNHPARYALVEVQNVHDQGLVFEPIHRAVFNVQPDFIEGFSKIVGGEADCCTYTKGEGIKQIKLPANAAVAVAKVQDYIDEYIKTHPNAWVDYVHGLNDLKEVVDNNESSIGITLPPLNKSDLFNYVLKVGTFPRKTFSMGEAAEKRYYVESKKIK